MQSSPRSRTSALEEPTRTLIVQARRSCGGIDRWRPWAASADETTRDVGLPL